MANMPTNSASAPVAGARSVTGARRARWRDGSIACAALASVWLASSGALSAQEGLMIPAPVEDIAPSVASGSAKAVAVFAGGCFWGVQGVFQHVEGVSNAVSGYAGGTQASASYPLVSSGMTSHAEAVQITYDPARISYGKLLQIFFSAAHDPTQLNRQGPDRGAQYRTAVFPQDEAQARVVKAYIAQLNQARVYDKALMTKIEPDRPFYAAEPAHQDYLTRNPDAPYIVINDLPKIEALKHLFPQDYRAKPVLVSTAR